MKIKINPTLNRIHPVYWQLVVFAVSLSSFTFILLNRKPGFLRDISIAARIDFLPIIPILAILVYMCFRLPGRIGELIAFTATMILFALPLAGLWASGHTHTTVLSGVIPISDAEGYYTDAMRLLNGVDFSDFAARRPFFPGLLAVLLYVTNYNLMTCLAIFTALVGLAAYLTSREVERTNGREVAVFILMMIFMFYRLHSGINMSENIGTALGLLGFAMFWRGASKKTPQLIYFALFTTTLALNARAGAFFILPFLILWSGWIFKEEKKTPWKVMFFGVSAVVLGFVIDLVLTRLLATPSGVPFANFSYSFYGLASGGNSWAYIYEAHPEVFLLPAAEQSKRIYQLSLELIQQDPSLIIHGALFNWKILFSDTLYSLYSYVAHENWAINPITKWTLYSLSLLGIFTCAKNINEPKNGFILAGVAGIFLSIPFAPTIDAFRMRPYAATIANMVILPAMGLDYLLKKSGIKLFNQASENKSQPVSVILLSSILIGSMIVGPVAIRFSAGRDKVSSTAFCNPSLASIIIKLYNGARINIHGENSEFIDWAPDYHIDTFQREAHSLSGTDIIMWAQTIPPSSTVIMTQDKTTNSAVLVVSPTQFIPNGTGQYVELCGKYDETPQMKFFTSIFYVESSFSFEK